MSAYEGANLLIACMASIPPAECSAALDVFRPLAPQPSPTFSLAREFASVREAPTFGDALETLLTILPGMPLARTELTIARPTPHATLSGIDAGGRALWRIEWAADGAGASAGSCGALAVAGPDKRIAATVTETALVGLARLVEKLPLTEPLV